MTVGTLNTMTKQLNAIFIEYIRNIYIIAMVNIDAWTKMLVMVKFCIKSNRNNKNNEKYPSHERLFHVYTVHLSTECGQYK